MKRCTLILIYTSLTLGCASAAKKELSDKYVGRKGYLREVPKDTFNFAPSTGKFIPCEQVFDGLHKAEICNEGMAIT